MIPMNNETKLNLLATMLRIRKVELQVARMYQEHKLLSAPHLYEGEEAIATGVCAHLRREDYITSTHRGHGHCIAKGMEARRLLAEIAGKRTGCCGGKGGSMHLFDPAAGIMGTSGIVGGGIPIANGLALASQLRGDGRVTVCFFGEGASNNGAFHESLNLASLWRLPVVFVCENNRYATSVHVRRSTAVEHIGVRAAGYNMPGVTVDGNRVDDVYAAAAEAARRARAGEGPTLLDCETYRIRGHFEGDDCYYRTEAEVEEERKRDPLEYWKDVLMREAILDEPAFETMNAALDREAAEAAAFADESPLPAPEEALILTGEPA